jgi:ankyrin repeat protein
MLQMINDEDLQLLVSSDGHDFRQWSMFGWTPLHFAVATGSIALVKRLLNAGCDPCAEASNKAPYT